jgi:hypothetical protein
MERFDWYVPGTKHTPFIAFNGLSETFSEGIVGGGGGGGYTPPAPTNHTPVISSIIANPENIGLGDSSVITCNATDQDGDSLNYTWTKTGGTITGSGKTITWTAPATADTYTVTCTVDDGKGKQDSESVNIDVSDGVTGVYAVAITYHVTSKENIQAKLDELFKKEEMKQVLRVAEPRNISKGDITYAADIVWDEYIGSTTYKIYKKVNEGSFSVIAEPTVIAGEGPYEYPDTDVSPGNTYTYYVTAVINTIETPPSRYATSYHLPSCSLSSPIDGSSINNSNQIFSWSPVGINSFPYGPITTAKSELYVYDLTNSQTVWWPFFYNLTTSSVNYNQDGQATALVNGHQYYWESWGYGYDADGYLNAVSMSQDWGFVYNSEPTCIISLSGDTTFEDVHVGESKTQILTISNTGNSALDVTGISYPYSVFSGNFVGSIAAGASQPVDVTFAPTEVKAYGGTLTVSSNKTDGTNTKSISGTGTPITTTIMVTSPNGGETWNAGGTRSITWTVLGDISHIDHFILNYGTNGICNQYYIDITSSTSRSYSWIIPNTPSTQCKIGVWAIDASNNSLAFDDSDGLFTISPVIDTCIIRLEGDLNFGDVQVGDSAQRTLIIYNDGNSTLNVTGINYSTPDFSGDWSGPISAGASQPVDVTFAPTQEKYYSGTLTVNSNKTGGTNTKSVSGTGTPITTTIIVTSPNGGETWNAGGTRSITWTVSGDISHIDHFMLGYGTNGICNQYYIDTTSSASRSYSWIIPNTPSTQCKIGVWAIDASNNSLTFDDSDGLFTISSVIDTRIISLSGDTTFGDVHVGESKTQTLTISNTGNSTLNVTGINYSTPDFIGDWSGPISAGASQPVDVTFAPTQEKYYSGTLTVSSNKTDGTNTKSVTGNGILPDDTRIISLSGDLDFGTVQLGSTPTKTLRISNTGNDTLQVTGINYPFSVFSGDFVGNIAPGDYENVTVTFAPTAAQTYSGTLTVNSNKTGGTNTITVSGTGGGCINPPIDGGTFVLAWTYPSSTEIVSLVHLCWADYTGADGYRVYRSTNGGDFTLLFEETESSSIDYSVTPGNTYSYYVTAFGSGWETCPSDQGTTTVLPSCALISPTDNATVTDPTPIFTWNPVGITSFPYGVLASATSYLSVYDQTVGSTTWEIFFDNLNTSSATYNQDGQATPLIDGRSYEWTIYFRGADSTDYPLAISSDDRNFVYDQGFDTCIINLSGDTTFEDVHVGESKTQTLTISNTGNSTLNVTGINYSTPDFSGDWSGPISAGASQPVDVTFAPTQVKTYSGTLTVSSNKTDGTNTKSVSGTGISDPDTRIISLSGDMAFDSVNVSGDTATRTLTISNTGNSSLDVTGISYPYSVFSGNFVGSIAAGSSQPVDVTFDPSAVQTYSGTLTVNSNKTGGTNTRSISGTGVQDDTCIINLSGDLDFGEIYLNTTYSRTLTISNTGNSTLHIYSINHSTTGFSNSWAGDIPAGESHNVPIYFRPTEEKYYSGTITVNSNATGGISTKSESGTGIIPRVIISLSGDTYFGEIYVGHTAPRTLTISNTGNARLVVDSISYSTAGFSGDWFGNIEPGESQDVSVTFSPTQEKYYSGILTVNCNKTSGTNTKSISGTGKKIDPPTTSITVPSSGITATSIELQLEIISTGGQNANKYIIRTSNLGWWVIMANISLTEHIYPGDWGEGRYDNTVINLDPEQDYWLGFSAVNDAGESIDPRDQSEWHYVRTKGDSSFTFTTEYLLGGLYPGSIYYILYDANMNDIAYSPRHQMGINEYTFSGLDSGWYTVEAYELFSDDHIEYLERNADMYVFVGEHQVEAVILLW